MSRPLSKVAPDWWDYTTLPQEIIDDAAALTADDLEDLARPGFEVAMYDTLEDFYLAEALEYITAWEESTPDAPAGICGPIGPTEDTRPGVARSDPREVSERFSEASPGGHHGVSFTWDKPGGVGRFSLVRNRLSVIHHLNHKPHM